MAYFNWPHYSSFIFQVKSIKLLSVFVLFFFLQKRKEISLSVECIFASIRNSKMLNVMLASLFDSLMLLCPQIGAKWQCDALALMKELLLKRAVQIELKV